MKNFTQLKKNLKNNFLELKKIKLAVLGDNATQFLVQALRGTGYDYDLDLQIWESDFNQIERQVFDTTSELYEFNPEIILVYQSSHKLLGKYNKSNSESYNNFANDEIESIKNIYTLLTENLKCKVFFFNYSEIDDAIFWKLCE